ncbi:MAG TPA: HD domain-containing protein [Solirubrobacterales bacterium]
MASDKALSFTRDLPVSEAAVAFARQRHAGQARGGDEAPYVVHPLEAASLLERAGYSDEVVAAAVLHDVLEDTETRQEELDERFGAEVANLVATLTDDPTISDDDEQRDEVRERVYRAGGSALAIYGADKVSKVRELRLLLTTGVDPEIAESKRRHYEKCLGMLEELTPGAPIAELLRFELEALREFPPVLQG